jgi:hypothetical protein
MVKRATWLSVTPEPERELPGAVATLAAGGAPDAAAVERERRRVEQLILRGGQRRWLAYLHDVVELIDTTPADVDPELARARARAAAVIANHHNLLLALPGPGAAATAADRARLARISGAGHGNPDGNGNPNGHGNGTGAP